jgi:hypothetical protein
MSVWNKIKEKGLASYVLDMGGKIQPLILPPELTGGTGLMNPSVYFDNDVNKLYVNIRHINYTLYHSENRKFSHLYGPLQYIHPYHDRTLTTINYLCELNQHFHLKSYFKVDTSKLDKKPKWHFIGLEDARLFKWNGKYYLCGVRRDTIEGGQGRMELSEIEISDDKVEEVSRFRIPTTKDDKTYCEKNWVPILDMPYQFVKWTNPTEVVKINRTNGKTETVILDETKKLPLPYDLRGSSQVINFDDFYFTITHETQLFKDDLKRKDGLYRHRIIVWDKNFNFVHYTPSFSFMMGNIEFCCGATLFKNNILISFGFQDNSAFILEMPKYYFTNLINL